MSPAFFSGLDPTEVLGGERLLTIQGNMSVGSIVANVDTTNGGSLTYTSNNPAFTDAFGGRLIIDHIPGSRIDTFDLSAFTNALYVIDFESAFFSGNGPLAADLSLSSPTGINSVGFLIPESSNPFSVAISLAQFVDVDFTQAFNLRLDISGIPSTGVFEISEISLETASVPEPASYHLLALFPLMILGLAVLKPSNQPKLWAERDGTWESDAARVF